MSKFIVQHRRGTTAQWAQHSDIVPKNGEIIIEDCSEGRKKLFVGDGVNTKANLHSLSTDEEFTTAEVDTLWDSTT